MLHNNNLIIRTHALNIIYIKHQCIINLGNSKLVYNFCENTFSQRYVDA